jgi:hypothetical protein
MEHNKTYQGSAFQRKQGDIIGTRCEPIRRAMSVWACCGLRTPMVIDIEQGRLELLRYFGNILNQFVDSLNVSRGYMPYEGTERFLINEQKAIYCDVLNSVKLRFAGSL